METKSMLQIVSGFKPAVDGMGDFSRRLGDALWKQNSIRSHFVVYRRPQSQFNAEEILPNTISYPPEPTPSAFLDHVQELRSQQTFNSVLLHYGPYGYAHDGKPAAFTKAIEELAKTTRVLIFFHEIFASGMPWRRAFWTRSEQRECVGALLRIADVAFTSSLKYQLMLEPLNTTDRELIQIPIFSNIGEPNNLRPLKNRTRQLVVFGQLVTRVRLYRNCRSTLEDVCRRLQIEKIVDVGSGKSPHIPDMLAGAKVTKAGWMDEGQLSDLMADSIAGIVGYWPDVWQKSGVIAAYQAHALVPIMVELQRRSIAKPAFLPYVSAERLSQLSSPDGTVSDANIQSIADAALDFYVRNQSVDRCAEIIARFTFRG